MTSVRRDDRVEMVGIMAQEPDPIPVGTQGTVQAVYNQGTDMEQIVVRWDTKRSLMLLPQDPFRVLPRAT